MGKGLLLCYWYFSNSRGGRKALIKRRMQRCPVVFSLWTVMNTRSLGTNWKKFPTVQLRGLREKQQQSSRETKYIYWRDDWQAIASIWGIWKNCFHLLLTLGTLHLHCEIWIHLTEFQRTKRAFLSNVLVFLACGPAYGVEMYLITKNLPGSGFVLPANKFSVVWYLVCSLGMLYSSLKMCWLCCKSDSK